MTNIGLPRGWKTIDEVSGEYALDLLANTYDAHTPMEEGYYNIYGRVGARTEMPGCSRMGNQARVIAGTTVLSTSTRTSRIVSAMAQTYI